MRMSRTQVEEACERIEQHLSDTGRETQPTDVLPLAHAAADLRQLRDAYSADPAALRPYVDRLRDYSRRIGQGLSASREALASTYLEWAERERAARTRREACRDALLELARAEPFRRLEVPGGRVELHESRAVSLPRKGTPARRELAEIIEESGAWSQVAQLSPARLLRALDTGALDPDVAEQIQRICPVQPIHRIAGHRTDGQS
jgi:hypothetical protein